MLACLLRVVLIPALFSLTLAAKGKCLHCLGVGAELQRRLDNERPRNHLDLRHRLDSEGKRYGKVIDYKVSELRAVELMEDLCNVLNQYDLLWLEANHTSAVWGQPGWTWVKMRGDGAVHGAVSKYEVDKAEMRSRQKDLESFCGRVMEQQEDALTEAITGGTLETVDVSTFLCVERMAVCTPPADKEAEGGAGDSNAGDSNAGDSNAGDSNAKEEL